jgi:hypothetical protein
MILIVWAHEQVQIDVFAFVGLKTEPQFDVWKYQSTMWKPTNGFENTNGFVCIEKIVVRNAERPYGRRSLIQRLDIGVHRPSTFELVVQNRTGGMYMRVPAMPARPSVQTYFGRHAHFQSRASRSARF